MKMYLEGKGVDDLAQLMRLGIKRSRTVEETTAAEDHPAGLQLLISTVHKTPAKTDWVHFLMQWCFDYAYIYINWMDLFFPMGSFF